MSYGNIYSSTWWGDTSSNWGGIYLSLLEFLIESNGGSSGSITLADIQAFNDAIVADGGQAIDVDGLWAYVQSLPSSDEAEDSILAGADDLITPYGVNENDTYEFTSRSSWGSASNIPQVYGSKVDKDGMVAAYTANNVRYNMTQMNNYSKYGRGSSSVVWDTTELAFLYTATGDGCFLYPKERFSPEPQYGYSLEYKLASSTGELILNGGQFKVDLLNKTVVALGVKALWDWRFVDTEDGYTRVDVYGDFGSDLHNYVLDNSNTYYNGGAAQKPTMYIRNYFRIFDNQVMQHDSRPKNVAQQYVIGRLQGVNTTYENGVKNIVNQGLATFRGNKSHLSPPNSTESPFSNGLSYHYQTGTTTGYKRAAWSTVTDYTSNEYGRYSFYLKDDGVDDYVFTAGSKDGAVDWDYNGQDVWAAIHYNWTTGVWSNDSRADEVAELTVEDAGNGWRRFILSSTTDQIGYGRYVCVWCLGLESQTGNGGGCYVGEGMFERYDTYFYGGLNHHPTHYRGDKAASFVPDVLELNSLRTTDTQFSWVFDLKGDFRLQLDGSIYDFIICNIENNGKFKVNDQQVINLDTAMNAAKNDDAEYIMLFEYDNGVCNLYINNVLISTISQVLDLEHSNWTSKNLEATQWKNGCGLIRGIFTFNRILTTEEKATLIIE